MTNISDSGAQNCCHKAMLLRGARITTAEIGCGPRDADTNLERFAGLIVVNHKAITSSRDLLPILKRGVNCNFNCF